MSIQKVVNKKKVKTSYPPFRNSYFKVVRKGPTYIVISHYKEMMQQLRAALGFGQSEIMPYGEDFSGYYFYTYYPPKVIKMINKISNAKDNKIRK